MQKSSQTILDLLALSISITILLLIPFVVLSLGYLPEDDALRHSAKVVSQKNWQEILVVRPEITIDSHPGWHKVLEVFYRLSKCKLDGLIIFSVAFLFLYFALSGFFLAERQEAWLVVLGIVFLTEPSFLLRLFLGRPFIFSIASLVILLFLWPRFKEKAFPKLSFLFLVGLISLSTWIHGLWYIFLTLIPLSFFLAREFRGGFRITLALICGIILGASFTGKPLVFLEQTLKHAFFSLKSEISRLLVSEFQPQRGSISLIISVVLLVEGLFLAKRWERKRWDNPVFILAVLGWILGFKMARFWLDWGIPALLVWMTKGFEEIFKEKLRPSSPQRLAVVLSLSFLLFLIITPDTHSRWTFNLGQKHLSLKNPLHKEWLPEEGGILYSTDMRVFYQTFYHNPKGNWRYILGFEAGWMPKEDLEIYHNILLHFGALEAYKPWVEKMRPADRLVIRSRQLNPADILTELEWLRLTPDIFIGRLPRKK